MEYLNSQLFKLLDYPRGDTSSGRKLFEKISGLGVKELSFVSKGYRGVVFRGNWNGIPVAVKVPRSDSKKKNVVERECEILKYLDEKLKEKNPAPKPHFCGEKFIVMEWIEGLPFKEAFKKFGKEVVLKALESVYLLDEAKVEHSEIKGEKHLIFDGRIRVIDFESAKFKDKPRNLLQFVGYHLLRNVELLNILRLDKEKLLELLELYKENPSEVFPEIVSFFDK